LNQLTDLHQIFTEASFGRWLSISGAKMTSSQTQDGGRRPLWKRKLAWLLHGFTILHQIFTESSLGLDL